MDNKVFLLGLFLLSVANVKAQTQTQNDSLTMENMMHNLPEIMVKGSRPIVKAERGMLSYNMPLLMKQLPADNAYEALTRIPGVSDADGGIKFSGNEVTLIINGQATTLTQEQLADRLKAMPAAQLAKAEVMLGSCTLSCSWHGYKYRHERLCREKSVVGTDKWRITAKQIFQRVWRFLSFHAEGQIWNGCTISIY